MAQITTDEFALAVERLADHYGIGRLRDKLATLGAFSNRKGLTTAKALADRLHHLSGGLRLRVAATYAFTALWNEMLAGKLGGEDAEHELERIADRVNACLTEGERIADGMERELDQALADYRAVVARAVGGEVAQIDMLLKSVPAVAERIRGQAAPPAPVE